MNAHVAPISSNSGGHYSQPETPRQAIERIARQLAYDFRETVYVILTPAPTATFTSVLPYAVRQSQADRWEKENGIEVKYQ